MKDNYTIDKNQNKLLIIKNRFLKISSINFRNCLNVYFDKNCNNNEKTEIYSDNKSYIKKTYNREFKIFCYFSKMHSLRDELKITTYDR